MNYFIAVLKKYAVFSGRAQRAEYWYFYLFSMIINSVLVIFSFIIGDNWDTLGILFSLAIIIPTLAVTIRRLHDTGRSGWMILISLIPLVGGIWLLILMIIDSQAGENKYGPNPKGIEVV